MMRTDIPALRRQLLHLRIRREVKEWRQAVKANRELLDFSAELSRFRGARF